MPGQYLYNLEFNIDDYDLWTYPENLSCPEELPSTFHFEMDPMIELKITDDEYLEQINCDRKIVKNAMFSVNEQQMKNELNGKIVVQKWPCQGNSEIVGCYKFPDIESKLQQLMEQFDQQKCVVANQPYSTVKKELIQLRNDTDQPCGTVAYTLKLTCFGPTISQNQFDDSKSNLRKNHIEETCLDRAAASCPCPSQSKDKEGDFDEYSAEINGNQLIVRINKEDSSHLVTRVFDSNMDQNGNEVRRDKNMISILGCDQQIDFKLPKRFSCGDYPTTAKAFNCGPNSILTDYQRRTSCAGKSFKNSCILPVIRGNLKYPGRLDNGSVNFDLYDQCNPFEVGDNYKKQSSKTRGTCFQVDEDNMQLEQCGKCKIPKGIEVCKRGCSDPDTDVFILKIGRKKTNKQGRKNEIELEMRTPKGPDNEIKKMETREVQVEEKDFPKVCEKAKTPAKVCDSKKVSDSKKNCEKVCDSKKDGISQEKVKGFIRKK